MKTSIYNKRKSLFISLIMASAFIMCLAKNGYCSEDEIKEEKEENIVFKKLRDVKDFYSSNEETVKYYSKVTVVTTTVLMGLLYLRRIANILGNIDGRLGTLESNVNTIKEQTKPQQE